MEIADKIYQHVKAMPAEMASEVLDFVEFLEFKHGKNTSEESQILTHFQTSVEKNHHLGELLAK